MAAKSQEGSKGHALPAGGDETHRTGGYGARAQDRERFPAGRRDRRIRSSPRSIGRRGSGRSKEGKLEEARKSVSRLGSNEERALALIELATKAEAEKDQKSQRELLKEAGELLGNQMETRSQVEAQLVLAAASLNHRPGPGFRDSGVGD